MGERWSPSRLGPCLLATTFGPGCLAYMGVEVTRNTKSYIRPLLTATRWVRTTKKHSSWTKKKSNGREPEKKAGGDTKLPQLRLNSDRMQNLTDLARTMRDLQKTLRKKPSLRPQNRSVVLREEAPHAQRGGNISAFVPGIASIAKNVMGRDMEIALQAQQEFVASTRKRHVPLSMGNTESVFGIKKDEQTRTARNEGISPKKSSSQTSEFCSVVATGCGS